MPYCPRCDMEFVEGVTVCSDCGGPLLASEEEAKAMKAQMEKEMEERRKEAAVSVLGDRSPEELAEEGINLSHCVGQYVDRVAGGECHILFLRRRGAPDRSLVTLQLSGKQICQAQGFNRRPITDQERRFLVQWGREKDIQIAV